ncbi:MAG: ribbon-helix-helix domain-containing protein [Methanomassiliicoccales archaeon]
MAKVRSAPPTKERYDMKHPVVSIRVTEEQLKKLEVMAKTAGMPRAQIMRIALGIEVGKIEEVYWRGYFDGFIAGKRLYEGSLTFERCPKCGHVNDSEIGETEPDFGLPVSFPKYLDIKTLIQGKKDHNEAIPQGGKSPPAREFGVRKVRKVRKIKLGSA